MSLRSVAINVLLINHVLPEYRHRSVHCRFVAAAPGVALAAAQGLQVGEVRGLRLLLGLRALPASVSRRRSPLAAGGLFDLGMRYGFEVVAEDPGRAVVLGLIGQPWRVTGGEVVPFTGPAGFAAFARPGFVKVVVDFRAAPEGNGSELCTETRIAATDDVAAQRFRAYWTAIRPFSGLLRRSMLAAVARRTGPEIRT